MGVRRIGVARCEDCGGAGRGGGGEKEGDGEDRGHRWKGGVENERGDE